MSLRVTGVLGALIAAAALCTSVRASAEPVDGTKVASAVPPRRTASFRAVATSPTAPKEEASDDGPLDPFRIGAFGGVGFPRPLSIEGFIKVEKLIGFGVEYSALPTMSVSGVNAGMYAIAGDLRVFPLSNGFFVGFSAGRQHFDSSLAGTPPPQLQGLNPYVSCDTWFINPRIGYLSTWKWGGTLGIDIGLQIPVSTSLTNTIPAQLSISQDAQNVASFFGKSVLPTVDLLRLGILL